MELKETCSGCKFYYPADEATGTCHRFPPQRGMQAVELPPETAGEKPPIVLMPDTNFPLTQPQLWCGEFAPAPISKTEGTA